MMCMTLILYDGLFSCWSKINLLLSKTSVPIVPCAYQELNLILKRVKDGFKCKQEKRN